MHGKWVIAAGLILSLALSVSRGAGPVPPGEAAGKMTLPEGFSATLFCGEPDVVQPIAFTFDDRERLWVAECLSYPQWDMSGSLTGHDRILIFEDTTGSGHFDKKTVFAENLANLSGLEIGFGGVFVCSSPNLLFIPVDDVNSDTPRPTGPPRVLLDGWNIKQCQHNVFNRLTWGPDGWLWGLNGIQSRSLVGTPGTPDAQRTFLDCGVWRYHPKTHAFEVVAHGTTNPWGLDFDDMGQAFISNCVINHLWHVIPGGHYERMSGHGSDDFPYAFAPMTPCADHLHFVGTWTDVRKGPNMSLDVGGGHAHVGAMVYLGDNWPDSFRNSIFMCNLHGHRVNHDVLEHKGSGYVAHHGKDFLLANDDWFRGLNLAYGPDGGVFLSDWCDTGECHNHIQVDRSNGRIFKVTYGKVTPAKVNLSKLADTELVGLLLHKNDWFVRHARRLLQERSTAGTLSDAARPAMGRILRDNEDITRKLRAAWALNASGGLDESQQQFMLASPDEYVRNWGVRLALESGAPDPKILSTLTKLAESDPSPVVRVALASGMQRLPANLREPIAVNLIRHGEDASDANLPLMIWYGIEPVAGADVSKAAALIGEARIPLVRQYLARRAATSPDADLVPLMPLLSGANGANDVVRLDVLRGLLEAFEGRRHIKPPEGWSAAYAALEASHDPALRNSAIDAAVVFGDEAAFVHLRELAADNSKPADERESALRGLVQARDQKAGALLIQSLSDVALRGPAIKLLAETDDPAAPKALLAQYASFTDDQKRDAIAALASRRESAMALLDGIASKAIAHDDLSTYNLRQLKALNDRAVMESLGKVWGAYRPAAADKAKTIAGFKASFTPEVLQHADAGNGRAVFARTCAACHTLFDTGGNVGPNLTGSQRSNLDYLIENIVDPSAIVAKDYLLTTVRTKDGRVIDGIIVQENESVLVLRTPTGDTRMPKDEIDRRKTSPVSMMPEGLLEGLPRNDARDLLHYLQSPAQVPIGGTR
jgi:putative membrane-bound dehydrogenase-like protein